MGKPRIGSHKHLFKHLDLTPIQSILWTSLHKQGPGRPVQYNPECDLRDLMLRQLLQIPYIKDLVKRLRRDPYLRQVCGYHDKAPCETHFTQMKNRIGSEGFQIARARKGGRGWKNQMRIWKKIKESDQYKATLNPV